MKAIALRLKSVKNIQKITQSMKMVSAAKYARAERDLKAARPYGVGAQSFFDAAQVGRDEEGKPTPVVAQGGEPKELYVALTSDRGLCGAVHSSICKTIRAELQAKSKLDNVGIICVGDKSRAQLSRYTILDFYPMTVNAAKVSLLGYLLKTSFALAPKLAVCHLNLVMLPRLQLPS